MQEIKSRGLTRDAIKMIAMLTMFFNHFSHVFLTAGTYPAEFLKGIGYFTAPVMCYFLVEGFYKPRPDVRMQNGCLYLRWCPRCPIFWHLTERRQS